MKYQENINSFNSKLFYALPITVIFSTFLSNLIIFCISIYGLYYILNDKNQKFFYNKYSLIFISFCIFISINSLLSLELDFKSIKSSFLFIRYLFFIFGIYYLYKFNKEIFKNFFNVYIILLIILFIDSNYQFFNNGVNLIGYESFIHQHNRISSLFFDELVLGSYVQKFTILMICYFLFVNNYKEKFIPFILLISLEICFISGERLAFYTLLIFSIIYFIFFTKISYFKKLFAIFLIFFTFIIAITINPSLKNCLKSDKCPKLSRMLGNTFESVISSKYFSPGHKKHLDIALLMFYEKPITGYGSNKFRSVCSFYEKKHKIKGCSTHPHNIIAQFLSEKGIIGIIFIAVFYYFLTINIFKNINYRKDRKKRATLLLLFSIFLFFNPIFPSANFYNSWVNNIIYIIFSYLIIFNSKKINT